VPIAGGNQAICSGDSVHLGAASIKGISYSWTSRPVGFTSTFSNPAFIPGSAATYYLMETVNAAGCTGMDSAKITLNPLPITNTGGNHTICAGATANLGSTSVNGDTYSWSSNPAGYVSTISSPAVAPMVTTIYYLVQTIAATGCSKTDSAIVDVNPLPLAVTGKNQSICAGGSVQLGAGPINGHTYQWVSSPQGFSSSISNPVVQPNVMTAYILTETIGISSCVKTDSAVIKVNPLPKPDAGKPQTVCTGTPVHLGYPGTSGDTYQWSRVPAGFSSTIASPTDSPSASNIYTYFIRETDTATGCSSSDSVKVTVDGLPIVSLISGPSPVCTNDPAGQYQVSYHNGSTYQWSISHGTIVTGQGSNVIYAKFDTAGASSLTVSETNLGGCRSISSSTMGIAVISPPDAHFKVLGDSPVYVFKAIDTIEKSYQWAFGDGTFG